MIDKSEFRAMGCHVQVALESDSLKAHSRLESVPEWFEAWEDRLSRFRPYSELNRLNHSEGQPQPVSADLWKVYQVALEAERLSAGLVTPYVLEALVQAGYDRSFEQFGALQESNQPNITQPRSLQPARAEKDTIARIICLPNGAKLDFGGIAKGWAAHQAMSRLEIYGSVMVDAGGDIAISRLLSDQQGWPIGIADPFQSDALLGVLELGRSGVATSGIDYRRWQQNGTWKHHIIDPRTGQPAQTDLLSVTVISPNVMDAEMAAKRVLISGSQAGLAWLETHPNYAGLLVLQVGECIQSRNFQRYLRQPIGNIHINEINLSRK